VPQVPVIAVAAPQPAPIAQHAPARIVEPSAPVPPSSIPVTTLGTPVEPRSSTSNPVTAAPGAAVTDVAANNVPTNTVAHQKSAPPKLQSIMYQPGRPEATISGNMVFIGDKFGAWRVAAIDQESA